ncbi:MAG: hypothetical protein ABL888_15270 [Pirellulaceae bacterium]
MNEPQSGEMQVENSEGVSNSQVKETSPTAVIGINEYNRLATAQTITRNVLIAMASFLVFSCAIFYFSPQPTKLKAKAPVSKWNARNPFDWLLWAAGRETSTQEIVDRNSKFTADDFSSKVEIPTFNSIN